MSYYDDAHWDSEHPDHPDNTDHGLRRGNPDYDYDETEGEEDDGTPWFPSDD